MLARSLQIDMILVMREDKVQWILGRSFSSLWETPADTITNQANAHTAHHFTRSKRGNLHPCGLHPRLELCYGPNMMGTVYQQQSGQNEIQLKAGLSISLDLIQAVSGDRSHDHLDRPHSWVCWNVL